jgi:hypothetical protein
MASSNSSNMDSLQASRANLDLSRLALEEAQCNHSLLATRVSRKVSGSSRHNLSNRSSQDTQDSNSNSSSRKLHNSSNSRLGRHSSNNKLRPNHNDRSPRA